MAVQPTTFTHSVFRAAAGMRLMAVVLLLLSGQLIVTAATSGHWAASILLALPAAGALAILLRRLEVEEDSLVSYTMLGTRRLDWSKVRRVDVRRGSFVIESARGPISAALIDPRGRERLLRAIIERAKLTRDPGVLPFGIESRYVPRAQSIEFSGFVPHNRRTT